MKAERAILTLNAGSSSLKFAAYALAEAEPRALLSGEIENIQTHPALAAREAAGHELDARTWPAGTSYDALLAAALEFVRGRLGEQTTLIAAGHRVVHGGASFAAPVAVDDRVLAELEALASYAPLHNPHSVAAIAMLLRSEPSLLNVACFDTAFHARQSPLVRRFGLPRALEREGLVRYGFHGLSYEYIARRLRELDPASSRARTIVAHLGNGASLCALRDGASVATTMGFSVLDGLVMGTRCGSLDPGAVLFLLREKGYDAARLEHLLYRESGLLGISEISSDMRELRASADPRAREAIDTFVYRIVRETGSLAAALGGLDAIVFTAGIGEHDAALRAEVCSALAWLGVELDPAANARASTTRDATRIGAGRVTVWTIPTDEDSTIARDVARIATSAVAG